jgi:uncharacterized nucleotidyltransferase DUF6036
VTRAQLEHIIRASAAISGDDEIVIVGSQSILGSVPDASGVLTRSMEADVYPRHCPERADLIEGSIGEDSMFHQTFGYFAQAVGPETSVLPDGWESRLVAIHGPNTRGATGWALDPHDLAVAKYVAGREKDHEFLASAISTGLLDRDVLLGRIARTGRLAPERRAELTARAGRDFARAE